MYATMKNDSSRYFLFRDDQHNKIIENRVELRVGNSLLASKASQNSTIWNDPMNGKDQTDYSLLHFKLAQSGGAQLSSLSILH